MIGIIGHNYIGGQRSAAGSIKLQSVDASTGEALPHDLMQASSAFRSSLSAAKAGAAASPRQTRSVRFMEAG